MAEDIAREIIAQSKRGGGGKLALKFSVQQQQVVWELFFSSSKDANQKMIYHIYFTEDDKPFEIKYSNLEGACDFVTYVMAGKTWFNSNLSLQLVILNKNISECIALSPLEDAVGLDFLSSTIKKLVNVLDVIDVVEG